MHFLCTLLIQYQGVDKHEYFTRFQIDILVWSPNLHHLWQCTNHLWQCLYRSHSGSFKDVILCILYTASVFILLQVCLKKLPIPPQTYMGVHVYIIYVIFKIFCLCSQTCTLCILLVFLKGTQKTNPYQSVFYIASVSDQFQKLTCLRTRFIWLVDLKTPLTSEHADLSGICVLPW